MPDLLGISVWFVPVGPVLLYVPENGAPAHMDRTAGRLKSGVQ